MSAVAAIIGQLQDSMATTGLKLVAGAAAFQAAAESHPTALPAAFVFTLEEAAGESPVAPDVIQRVTASIGVVLVVRNVGDSRGSASGQDMETLRAAVKAQLLGWAPATGHDPLTRSRSHLLAFRDGHMYWQDIYTTSHFDRSVQ